MRASSIRYFGRCHLWRLLQAYVRYYNPLRTQLGIDKDSPETREVQTDGEIDKVAVVNGLHLFYAMDTSGWLGRL